MSEYKCEVCGKPLSYSGRGRPPKRCDEHKGAKTEASTPSGAQGSPRPRPRPGVMAPRPEPDAVNEAPRAAPPLDPGVSRLPPPGKSDVKSRSKAEAAAERTITQNSSVDSEAWPRGVHGKPMAKVTMTASELVPTGQYANVSVGPAQITAFVDLDRVVGDDEAYFTNGERDVLTKALNELGDVVERDVIGVQRNIVLESMQEQLASNGK